MSDPPHTLTWLDPVDKLPGLGPARSEFLRENELPTVGALLLRAPLRLIDRRACPPFNELESHDGEDVTAVGVIESVGEKGKQYKRRLIAYISDGSGGYLSGVWFNKYYHIKDKLIPGRKVVFSGKVTFFDGPQIAHPTVTYLDQHADASDKTGLIPIYSSGEQWNKMGFTPRSWQRLYHYIIDEWDGSGPYPPTEIQHQYQLKPYRDAVRDLHFPETLKEYDEALRSLKFSELFLHQLLMVALRRRRRMRDGQVIAPGERYDRFLAALPFQLSPGQRKVLDDISADLQAGRPMHRLLEGEVGSGKTVVAFAAAAMIADSGRQTAIMAPTELLARQHYGNAIEWLEKAGLKTVLIAAGRNNEELKQALFEAGLGSADVIIGTHALFQERVKLKRLGLVVIDEQQRFGVEQRSRLIGKGSHPHVLLMTATPIPRTLALAHYGDLDLSELTMRPDVPRNVITRLTPESSRDKVFGWLREQLQKGERGYLVFPVIDEGTAGLQAAEAKFEPYRRLDFKGIPVGLMHGRQPVEERIKTMDAFRAGTIRLLMATAVVEVGVDVPEANIMVVENSERFGLAQLHQLRGRVGRTGQKAYCVLLTGETPGELGFERLKRMEASCDGFQLAEDDLRLRGSGEPLGARQSGAVKFRLADLGLDLDLLKMAHNAAEWLFEKHPGLEPYPELREQVRREYRSRPRTYLAG